MIRLIASHGGVLEYERDELFAICSMIAEAVIGPGRVEDFVQDEGQTLADMPADEIAKLPPDTPFRLVASRLRLGHKRGNREVFRLMTWILQSGGFRTVEEQA